MLHILHRVHISPLACLTGRYPQSSRTVTYFRLSIILTWTSGMMTAVITTSQRHSMPPIHESCRKNERHQSPRRVNL
ncbi:hypothetical protein GQ43DRAFT_18342 [Delitschia confertaspora ATCC 74209]|uniref:Uncharacterized protein n=1 Tax=Delitschia confertaspora ATCC 74209 TaxID=1513339 RepID=A0A9P4JSR6_9PLEO|nr:hypothetical protein GQ43DRAFT_18342 [Delitschia confertaspora ATCC 74209]